MTNRSGQFHVFMGALKIATDEAAKGLQAGGHTPDTDALLLALGATLGERIALIDVRQKRRLILNEVVKLLEESAAR